MDGSHEEPQKKTRRHLQMGITPPSSPNRRSKVRVKRNPKAAKKKSGSTPAVHEAGRIEDEEAEEFEVVNVKMRPANCNNKKKAKIRWKHEERRKEREKECVSDDKGSGEEKCARSGVKKSSSKTRVSVVPEATKVEQEEAEEFVQVNAKMRAATCNNNKKAKIRWKHEERKKDKDEKEKEDRHSTADSSADDVSEASNDSQADVSEADDGGGSKPLLLSPASAVPSNTKASMAPPSSSDDPDPPDDADLMSKGGDLLKPVADHRLMAADGKTKESDAAPTSVCLTSMGAPPPLASSLTPAATAPLAPVSLTATTSTTAPTSVMGKTVRPASGRRASRSRSKQELSGGSRSIQSPSLSSPIVVSSNTKIVSSCHPIAVRVLSLIKQSNVLESCFYDEQNKMIKEFVERGKTNPSRKVAELLDRAMDYTIDTCLYRSENLHEPIDTEVRKFILDRDAAKVHLLDTMLSNPDLMPLNWGGATVKVDEHKLLDRASAELRKKEEEKKKEKVDKEKEKKESTWTWTAMFKNIRRK